MDKKSFIRAKQAQIHQDRAQRKHEIETLKYERIINDGLLTRIDALVNALRVHVSGTLSQSPDEVVFQSLIESAGDPAADKPPKPPAGIHANVGDQPTYSKMMAALVDQVKDAVGKTKPGNVIEAYVNEVGQHKAKVLDLQQKLLVKLAELEKKDGSKITSESIHTGFDRSQVSCHSRSCIVTLTHRAQVSKATADYATSTTTPSAPDTTVELLNNPSSRLSPTDSSAALDSGAEADVEDLANTPSAPGSRHIQPSHLGVAFGALPPHDHRASLSFISQHPAVLAARETDGLLIQAFDDESAGRHDAARRAVHQALLLQYCRSLGRDGVALFFKRINTPDHGARRVFLDDVNATYVRLRDRAKEIAAEEAAEAAAQGDAGVEQIQLHAVDPTQKIAIRVPSATDPEDGEARAIFDAFPPGLRRALESGSLDDINKVLGKMAVEEAEEVVEKLGDGGMLSMEQGIVDATTEEGRETMRRIEESGRMDSVMGNGPGEDDVEDAAMDMDEQTGNEME